MKAPFQFNPSDDKPEISEHESWKDYHEQENELQEAMEEEQERLADEAEKANKPIAIETKLQLKNDFEKFLAEQCKDISKIDITRYGLEWEEERAMYGGGYEHKLCDRNDVVLTVMLYNGETHISFNEEYFTEGFTPAEIIPFEGELLAEIMSEESLYGYEMYHYKTVGGASGWLRYG